MPRARFRYIIRCVRRLAVYLSLLGMLLAIAVPGQVHPWPRCVDATETVAAAVRQTEAVADDCCASSETVAEREERSNDRSDSCRTCAHCRAAPTTGPILLTPTLQLAADAPAGWADSWHRDAHPIPAGVPAVPPPRA